MRRILLALAAVLSLLVLAGCQFGGSGRVIGSDGSCTDITVPTIDLVAPTAPTTLPGIGLAPCPPPTTTTAAPPPPTTTEAPPPTTSTTTVAPPPTTTTAPPPAGPVVGSRQLFLGNYDTGNFGQWGQCQWVNRNTACSSYSGGSYSAAVVNDGAAHPTAARYELRNGDVPPFGGGERVEVSSTASGAMTYEGDERWYELDLKFDSAFQNPTGGWFIVQQWHAGSGSPPLALNVSNAGTLDIGGDGVTQGRNKPIGPIVRGQWVHYVLHVKFSQSSSVGFVEVWQDGQLVVPKYNRATMTSSSNYLKQGIYRDGSETATAVVFHDGLRVTAP